MYRRKRTTTHLQDEDTWMQHSSLDGLAFECSSGAIDTSFTFETAPSCPWRTDGSNVTGLETDQITPMNRDNESALCDHSNSAMSNIDPKRSGVGLASETPWHSDLHLTDFHGDSLTKTFTGLGQSYTPWPYLTDTHHPTLNNNDLSHSLQQNAASPALESSAQERDDSDTAIGTILKNGKFKCTAQECGNKSYARPAELKRHYNTVHAVQKPEFWCDVPSCMRSVAKGGRPFHRKYRLMDHMRKMHTQGLELMDDVTEVQEEVDADDTIGDDEL